MSFIVAAVFRLASKFIKLERQWELFLILNGRHKKSIFLPSKTMYYNSRVMDDTDGEKMVLS